MINNIKKTLILNGIILFGIILFFLGGYIFYKVYLTGKIYNNISKNIDYFIEFDLKNLDKFSNLLGQNQPFYTSYLDKMDFKKGAIIFYEGEKIDAILSGSKRKSIKFLRDISTKEEIEKHGDLIISNYSPAPNCIQNGNNLFCSKNTKILERFISDIQKGEILKKDKNFLKIENNLNIAGNFIFGYANIENKEIFPLISEKFISGGFTFWKENIFSKKSEIKGIFYGNYKKNSGEIFYEEKNFFDIEKFYNEKNTIFLAYSKDFSTKLEKYFQFYSEQNPEITKLGRNIFKQKKEEFKYYLEQNFQGKILFKNPKKDIFILSENSDFLSKNKIQIFDKNIYSNEKIFINLEKIRENFGLNILKGFKIFTAYSKNFDDGIQIRIQIK